MNNDPGLRLTFLGLTEEAPMAWDAAIQFFNTNRTLLQGIRNDIGGHFGHQAALNAISMLQPDACGSIALADDDQKLRLHFAAEIAATALLKRLPNGDIKRYEAFLRDFLTEGYKHAINCVYIPVRECLWERFGS